MIVDSDIVFHGSAWRLNRFRDNVWALYPSRAHHAYVFDWYSPDYTFMRNKLFHQLLQEKKISLIDPLPRYPERDGIYGDWNIFSHIIISVSTGYGIIISIWLMMIIIG